MKIEDLKKISLWADAEILQRADKFYVRRKKDGWCLPVKDGEVLLEKKAGWIKYNGYIFAIDADDNMWSCGVVSSALADNGIYHFDKVVMGNKATGETRIICAE